MTSVAAISAVKTIQMGCRSPSAYPTRIAIHKAMTYASAQREKALVILFGFAFESAIILPP
jgi:L-lysine 2,3-aminomutase